jgi:acyl-CoA dehydrogenase
MIMDCMLSEREQTLLEQTVEFCRTEVDPASEHWEQHECLPREIFTKAGERGLLGLSAPSEYGGQGISYRAYVFIIKELAKHYAALALDIAAHNALSLGHLLAFGSEQQKQAYAARLIRGEWLGAWALTEPNAGSDSRGIETTATETESGWEITGHKTFITQGRTADLLVVMASSGKTAAGKNEISAFLVLKDQVQPIRKIPTYGVRASETSELRFHRAQGELLGPRGRGQEQALAVLDHGRLGVAAVALGIAQAALDAALRYALQRRQFGQRIAEFEAIQWMSADASTALDAAKLLSLRAAGLLDQGKNITKEAAMAKLFASEAATRIGNAALQIHGGYGYSRDLPLERYLRDAKICEIGEGTSEIQRLVIARQVFREVEKGHTLGR